MDMQICVIEVKPLGKYKIAVTFSDDVNGIYDLKHLASKGIFKYWDEGDNFFKVFINKENNSIAWNESLEIDTLNCYLKIRNIDFETFKSMNKTEKYAFG